MTTGDYEWKEISCGYAHTIGITANGELCSWGCGEYGQLGHGNEDSVGRPKIIDSVQFCKKAKYVSCGTWHTAVVTTVGDLYTWYV